MPDDRGRKLVARNEIVVIRYLSGQTEHATIAVTFNVLLPDPNRAAKWVSGG